MKRIPYVLCIVGIIVFNILLQWMVYENEDMVPLVIILGLILMVSAIVCHVKRCHDIGKSGWFVLWLLVPIVNLFVLLYLMFTPSVPSSEQIGSIGKLPEIMGQSKNNVG